MLCRKTITQWFQRVEIVDRLEKKDSDRWFHNSKALPDKSVVNKEDELTVSYVTRKELLNRIAEKRGRKIISYVTSIRPNMSCNMAGDAIIPIIEQLIRFQKQKKRLIF